MICENCKTAGWLNRNGLIQVQQGWTSSADDAFHESELLHDLCHGCDCQHTTRIQTVRA